VETGEPVPALRAFLRVLPEPSDTDVARLIHRVEGRAVRREHRWILALAGVVVLLVAGLASWMRLDAARSLHARLESDVLASFVDIPHVSVSYLGQGEVAGTERSPVLFWQVGTVSRVLEPRHGLRVETPDGRVEAVGTRFTVERDVMGTRVKVDGGDALLRCGEAEPLPLAVGDAASCWPLRPAGLLARARAERQEGRPDDVRTTLERALRTSAAPDPARGEILSLLLDLDLERGDAPAALATARTYLAEGYTPREHEIREIVRGLGGIP